MLQVEAAVTVGVWHNGLQGLGEGLARSIADVGIADDGCQQRVGCHQSQLASPLEEVAADTSGQRCDVSMVISHQKHLYGPVVVGGTHEAQAIAREGGGVKLDADVEILACGGAEALARSLAGIHLYLALLTSGVEGGVGRGVHQPGTLLQLHHPPAVFSPIHALGISPGGTSGVGLPVVGIGVGRFEAVDGPLAGDDKWLWGYGQGRQVYRQRLSGGGQGQRTAVEGAAGHEAAVAWVGPFAPFDAQGRVIAGPSAILKGDGAAGFGQILDAARHAVQVAVDETGGHAVVGAIEGLAAEERETAVAVESRAAQRIVGTLEITVVEGGVGCPHKRTEIQTGDETAVAQREVVAAADGYLGLNDGLLAFGAVELRVAWIDQVYVAVVAEGDVFGLDMLADEMEHREVAVGTLGLSAVAGQHHIFGVVSHADEAQPVDTQFHGIGGG